MAKVIPHGTVSGYTYHACRCDACRVAMCDYKVRWKRGERTPRTVKPVPHGTRNGYGRYGCRCDLCRAAEADHARARRKPFLTGEKSGPKPSPVPHGTIAGYSRKCRCLSCTEASARYVAERRQAGQTWDVRNRDASRRANTKSRHKRRAAVANAGAYKVSDREWLRMVARYRECCAYCGLRKKLTMEHVIPISRGGRHAIGNLLPVCGKCNSSKGPKLLVEWRNRFTRNV